MKRLSLLFAIAAMSSAVFGQMTQVLTSPGIIDLKDAPTVRGANYITVKEGTTLYFYDPSDISLKYTIAVNNCDGLGWCCLLPAGVYDNSNDEYVIVTSVRNNDPYDYQDDLWNLSVYKLSTATLVQDVITDNEVANVSSSSDNVPHRIGSNVFVSVYTSTINQDHSRTVAYRLYKFEGSYTGVSQVQEQNDNMMAYPNPSHDKINLVYQATDEATSIKVYDVNGRQVARIPVGSNSTEYTLDVSNYAEGVYFYQINGKSQSFIVK